jgi:hypothetical protein
MTRSPEASLAPGRTHARSVADLARDLDEGGARPPVGPHLERIADAFTRDFPENVFLDLDLLGATLARMEDAERAEVALSIVRVSAEFGGAPIQFRYAHDFLYGFDWCRWVARDPGTRAAVGPFDLPFLRYLSDRARELCALIAEDDAKYGHVPRGTYRNPFAFSRSPEDEARLHRALAERDLVPVEAWSTAGRARWERPYAELREEVARELGLSRHVVPR